MTPHSLPWCGLRDLLNDPYGRPALNLGYLLDGVMGASSRRLEFERFSRRESRQQLKIVASGLNSRKSRVLSRGAGVPFFLIRRHTPFSPYVAPRFPDMSEINSLFRALGRPKEPDRVHPRLDASPW